MLLACLRGKKLIFWENGGREGAAPSLVPASRCEPAVGDHGEGTHRARVPLQHGLAHARRGAPHTDGLVRARRGEPADQYHPYRRKGEGLPTRAAAAGASSGREGVRFDIGLQSIMCMKGSRRPSPPLTRVTPPTHAAAHAATVAATAARMVIPCAAAPESDATEGAGGTGAATSCARDTASAAKATPMKKERNIFVGVLRGKSCQGVFTYTIVHIHHHTY